MHGIRLVRTGQSVGDAVMRTLLKAPETDLVLLGPRTFERYKEELLPHALDLEAVTSIRILGPCGPVPVMCEARLRDGTIVRFRKEGVAQGLITHPGNPVADLPYSRD